MPRSIAFATSTRGTPKKRKPFKKKKKTTGDNVPDKPWNDEQKAAFAVRFDAAFECENANALAECRVELHTGCGEADELCFANGRLGSRFGWHRFVLKEDAESMDFFNSYGPGTAARERHDEVEADFYAALEIHFDADVLTAHEAHPPCALSEESLAAIRAHVFPFIRTAITGLKASSAAARTAAALKDEVKEAVGAARAASRPRRTANGAAQQQQQQPSDGETQHLDAAAPPSSHARMDAQEAEVAAERAVAAAEEAARARAAADTARAEALLPWARVSWEAPIATGPP